MRVLVPALAAIALGGVSTAQIVITEEAKKPAATKQDDATANVFYKAFYLDNGASKYDEAIALYKKYLAASPKSDLAPRAARSLVNLLYRTEKIDDAKAAEEKFASLLAQRDRGARGRGEGRGARGEGRGARGEGRGGRGMRGGGGAGDNRQLERFKSMIERLEKQIAEAKEAGNDEQVERLGNQLERIKTRLKDLESGAGASAGRGGRGMGGRGEGRGGRGEGRQGRGGRRGGVGRALTDMSKEEAQQWVERMEGFMDRMRERVGEERAAEMEKNLKKMKELINAGKMEEAEKIRQELFRRR